MDVPTRNVTGVSICQSSTRSPEAAAALKELVLAAARLLRDEPCHVRMDPICPPKRVRFELRFSDTSPEGGQTP